MNKVRAFSAHLAGTIVLMAVLSFAIYAIWFPEPYGRGLGLPDSLLVAWIIQLGIGPLLTLILFKPGKRGLKFDLSFIALAQSAALLVSIWVIYQTRPVFVVFSVDRFEVVQPLDVSLNGAIYPVYTNFPMAGPLFAVAKLPTDPQESTDLLFSSLDGNGDVHNFAKYYQPYKAPHTDAVVQRAKPLSQLANRNAGAQKAITKLLGPDADLLHFMYVPFVMRREDMSAVIDPADGQVLGVLPITPW